MKEPLVIHTYGDPVLRKKALKVKDPMDKEMQTLIGEMLTIMRANNGVGLAAPQVGKQLRLCVIEEGGTEYVLINPTITSKSTSKVISEEGCLSFPGEFFPIKRHEKVQVRYIDKEGKNLKIKASGLLSRALQHEIDHLDGILIVDRLSKKYKSKLKKTDGK